MKKQRLDLRSHVHEDVHRHTHTQTVHALLKTIRTLEKRWTPSFRSHQRIQRSKPTLQHDGHRCTSSRQTRRRNSTRQTESQYRADTTTSLSYGGAKTRRGGFFLLPCKL